MAQFCECTVYCGELDEKCPRCGRSNYDEDCSLLTEKDRKTNNLYLDGLNAIALLEANIKGKNVSYISSYFQLTFRGYIG